MHHIERADERGKSDWGWLTSRFTYSFAEYWNPQRMGFGALRVVNDDTVLPKSGFPLHHHEEMEIVTIMLEGTLTHEDSMGNRKEIKAGEVQVMTAGTGVNHSEWNHDSNEAVRLFQIWVYPKEKGLPPRYDQKRFDAKDRTDKFQVLVSGKKIPDALFVHQDVAFLRATLAQGQLLTHKVADTAHGLFLMVVAGEVEVFGETLGARDSMEMRDEKTLAIKATKDADMLLIEVPLG